MTLPHSTLVAHRRLLTEARDRLANLADTALHPPRRSRIRLALGALFGRLPGGGALDPADPDLTAALRTSRRLAEALTQLQALEDHRAEEPLAAWRGAMTTMDLIKVVRFVKDQTLSGRLRISMAPLPLLLWFRSGRIVHAVHGSLTGAAAVEGLIDAQGWFAPVRFSFVAGDQTPAQTIVDETTKIIRRLERVYGQHIQSSPAP